MNILSQKITPGMYLVKVEGPLSSREAEELIGVFRTLSEQGIKQVVVSLIDVPFLDSRTVYCLTNL